MGCRLLVDSEKRVCAGIKRWVCMCLINAVNSQFGDNVCVWTIHGSYDSDEDGSEFDGSEQG